MKPFEQAPLPWTTNERGFIYDANGFQVAAPPDNDADYAAEVVRRVNMHDALVAALDALKYAVESMPRGSMDTDEAWGNRVGAACGVAELALEVARGQS